MDGYLQKIEDIKPNVRGMFRFFIAIMTAFDFPVSARYNALHGPISLCALVATMAFTRSCSNAASRLLALRVVDVAGGIGVSLKSVHLPTSQWALDMLAKIGHDAMEAACAMALRACVAAARARGMIPPHPVGLIDGHNEEYYGEYGKKHAVRSKSKNGTTHFNSFMTSVVRANPYPLHTAVCRVFPGVPTQECLGKILAQNRAAGITCSHWILDRYFFSVAAMCEFGKFDEYFLMYARMTPGIKKAFEEYMNGTRAAMSEYIVKSGRMKFAGTLVFVKKTRTKKDGSKEVVVLPFFSNLPWNRLRDALDNLPIEMKKRWIQETAFRVAKLSEPMTASNSPSLRTFFFTMSLLVENMWVLADQASEARRRVEDREPLRPTPPADDRLGDRECLATKTIYNLTSKEFLSMLVSEAAKKISMNKKVQDDYTQWAVVKNAHLVPPMIQERSILTGPWASGIPRWA